MLSQGALWSAPGYLTVVRTSAVAAQPTHNKGKGSASEVATYLKIGARQAWLTSWLRLANEKEAEMEEAAQARLKPARELLQEGFRVMRGTRNQLARVKRHQYLFGDDLRRII